MTVSEIFISIHALVKRATYYRGAFIKKKCDFNPRPREEGDKLVGDLDYDIEHFNPRPREEGDRVQNDPQYSNILISIHALVKRATTRTNSNMW